MATHQIYIKDAVVEAWVSQLQKEGRWHLSEFVTDALRQAMMNEEDALVLQASFHRAESDRLTVKIETIKTKRSDELKKLRRELDTTIKTKDAIKDQELRTVKDTTIKLLREKIERLEKKDKGSAEHG
jgi:hypothetical protein